MSLSFRKLIANMKKISLSVDEFILKMKDLVNNLAAAGDNVTETNLVMYIIGGLGSNYELLTVILAIKLKQ